MMVSLVRKLLRDVRVPLLVLIILLACALQIGLIAWHHGDIAQLVQAVIVSNAALALALLTTFGLRTRNQNINT